MRFQSLRQYPASEAAIVVLPVPPLLVATTSTLAIRRSAPPVQRQFIMAEDDPNAMPALRAAPVWGFRSEEHTSELQSLMRISYAVFCLKKKKIQKQYIYVVKYTTTQY